jgi:hypothetical protein
MGKNTPQPSRKAVHTLAQTGTADSKDLIKSQEKIVLGSGSDLSDSKASKGRAKRKLVSQAMNLGLIAAVEAKGEPERKQAYWNAYHCQDKLLKHEDRVHGKYCKTRFCTRCSSIRKAEILNRYLPVMKTWEAPYFITLTVRSVSARNLKKWISGFKTAFTKIVDRLQKRNERGNGVRPVGIQSLECNFNPEKRTYNPHLHLIVESEAVADALIKEWLSLWTPKHAIRKCQDKQRVRNIEQCLIEVIKYSTKVFTDPDVMNKGKAPKKVYAAALDNIFQAMEPHRIFDRFGFNLPKTEKESKVQVVPVSHCQEYVFAVEVYDWVSEKTGERLTGFCPTAQLHGLLFDNIDTDLQ